MSDDITWRTCSKCREDYVDVPEQWKTRAKTRMTGTCRSCYREWHRDNYRRNKKAHGEKMKKWRKDNPDYHKEYMKTYEPKEENLL